MTVSRPLAIGGGIAAFVLVVAWMVPPTRPKGGETIAAAARPSRTPPSEPVVTPPVDASFSVPPPPPLPVDRSADAGHSLSAPPSPPQSMKSSPIPSEDRYALADPQEEFDRGYRWAERRQLQDPRECRRWADSPREDGCLAFLQDAREQGDDEED
jgi:hypothetical protein